MFKCGNCEDDISKCRNCEVWGRAERARQRLMVSDTPEIREQIADTAQESGVPSIWREVFAADIDMQQRFHFAFLGTYASDNEKETSPQKSLDGAGQVG